MHNVTVMIKPITLDMQSSSDNSAQCVSMLLSDKRTYVNIKDRQGRSPLFAAVKSGCEETVKYLCSQDGGACYIDAQDYADAVLPCMLPP